jgi:hypothetical protein
VNLVARVAASSANAVTIVGDLAAVGESNAVCPDVGYPIFIIALAVARVVSIIASGDELVGNRALSG